MPSLSLTSTCTPPDQPRGLRVVEYLLTRWCMTAAFVGRDCFTVGAGPGMALLSMLLANVYWLEVRGKADQTKREGD